MKYLICNNCLRKVSNIPVANKIYLKEAGIYCDDRKACEERVKNINKWKQQNCLVGVNLSVK